MRFVSMIVPLLLAGSLLGIGLLPACGGDDETADDPAQPAPKGPAQTRTILIGLHTDLTQSPANAVGDIGLALQDMAQYYNDENLIPGARFEVTTYDGQFNPALDMPGYEQLRARGADFIFSPPLSTQLSLKSRLEQDQVVLFSPAPRLEAIDPPGWVFGIGHTCVEYAVYTLLDWITENDPDFPPDRPARIGGAVWNEAYGEAVLRGAETYCQAHPDQYEWVYGELTDWKFSWGAEVQALKDCDYVIPNTAMASFVQQYRGIGGTGKFIAPDGHTLFLGQIHDAEFWDEIDGALFVKSEPWWNDKGKGVSLLRDLLYEYHPDKAEEIMKTSIGYTAGQHIYIMFRLISDTVKAVGTEAFDSQALYDTAQSFSMTLDGGLHSFGPAKRTSSDSLLIYEARAESQDIFKKSDWIPIVYAP